MTVLGSKSQAMNCPPSQGQHLFTVSCLHPDALRPGCGDHGVSLKGCGGDKVRQVFLLQDGSQAVTG